MKIYVQVVCAEGAGDVETVVNQRHFYISRTQLIRVSRPPELLIRVSRPPELSADPLERKLSLERLI